MAKRNHVKEPNHKQAFNQSKKIVLAIQEVIFEIFALNRMSLNKGFEDFDLFEMSVECREILPRIDQINRLIAAPSSMMPRSVMLRELNDIRAQVSSMRKTLDSKVIAEVLETFNSVKAEANGAFDYGNGEYKGEDAPTAEEEATYQRLHKKFAERIMQKQEEKKDESVEKTPEESQKDGDDASEEHGLLTSAKGFVEAIMETIQARMDSEKGKTKWHKDANPAPKGIKHGVDATYIGDVLPRVKSKALIDTLTAAKDELVRQMETQRDSKKEEMEKRKEDIKEAQRTLKEVKKASAEEEELIEDLNKKINSPPSGGGREQLREKAINKEARKIGLGPKLNEILQSPEKWLKKESPDVLDALLKTQATDESKYNLVSIFENSGLKWTKDSVAKLNTVLNKVVPEDEDINKAEASLRAAVIKELKLPGKDQKNAGGIPFVEKAIGQFLENSGRSIITDDALVEIDSILDQKTQLDIDEDEELLKETLEQLRVLEETRVSCEQAIKEHKKARRPLSDEITRLETEIRLIGAISFEHQEVSQRALSHTVDESFIEQNPQATYGTVQFLGSRASLATIMSYSEPDKKGGSPSMTNVIDETMYQLGQGSLWTEAKAEGMVTNTLRPFQTQILRDVLAGHRSTGAKDIPEDLDTQITTTPREDGNVDVVMPKSLHEVWKQVEKYEQQAQGLYVRDPENDGDDQNPGAPSDGVAVVAKTAKVPSTQR